MALATGTITDLEVHCWRFQTVSISARLFWKLQAHGWCLQVLAPSDTGRKTMITNSFIFNLSFYYFHDLSGRFKSCLSINPVISVHILSFTEAAMSWHYCIHPITPVLQPLSHFYLTHQSLLLQRSHRTVYFLKKITLSVPVLSGTITEEGMGGLWDRKPEVRKDRLLLSWAPIPCGCLHTIKPVKFQHEMGKDSRSLTPEELGETLLGYGVVVFFRGVAPGRSVGAPWWPYTCEYMSWATWIQLVIKKKKKDMK